MQVSRDSTNLVVGRGGLKIKKAGQFSMTQLVAVDYCYKLGHRKLTSYLDD